MSLCLSVSRSCSRKGTLLCGVIGDAFHPVIEPLSPFLQVDASAVEGLDMLNQPPIGSSGYLTCDSQANSDYDETDAEGEAYTDQELDEPYEEQSLARSSEPAEHSHNLDLSERVAAALAYPIDRVRRSKALFDHAARIANLVEPVDTLGMLREGSGGCCHKMVAIMVWSVTKQSVSM